MSQVMLAMSDPVVHPSGPRKAKVTATNRMALIVSLKSSVKRVPASVRKTPNSSPKKKTINVEKLAKRAHKIAKRAHKKAHTAFKKELKETRRKLTIDWKTKAKSLKKKNKKTKKLSETHIKENKMIRMVKTEMKRREKISKAFEDRFGVSMSYVQEGRGFC